ncbi:MAG TPA: hypothetical protein VIR78_07520, partial [Malonomonas sp.]
MKRVLAAIILSILVSGFAPGAALAGPDEYIGDAAIYTLSGGSAGVKPNILFIIDNSNASMNVSVGYAYDPANDSPYAGTFNSWDIYIGNNQGEFSTVLLANADNTLSNLTCSTDIDDAAGTQTIKESLLTYGSYASAGSADHPNIAANGSCATGPKGDVYVLGDYLNYLNSTASAPDGTGVCVSDFGGPVIVEGGSNPTKNNRYKLMVDHTAAATNLPGVGANWDTYWDYVGG